MLVLANDKTKTVVGTVVETLPNYMFRVDLDSGGQVLAHLSGKLRVRKLKIVLGDRVEIELSPYDSTRGRIIRRI